MKSIDEQIENAEARLKRLKKIKAERKLREENLEFKDKLKKISELPTFVVNFSDKNGEKIPKKCVQFDDVISILEGDKK